jgi:hypothetical protein
MGKKQKLRTKIGILYDVANEMISLKRRAEEERDKAMLKPQRGRDGPTTEKQKKVQDNFANRARVASKIYHTPGVALTWAEAMVAAGALISSGMDKQLPAGMTWEQVITSVIGSEPELEEGAL